MKRANSFVVENERERLLQCLTMERTERSEIPEWAAREREEDLKWIGENTHVLLPIAKLSYEDSGRGAILVDTNTIVERGDEAGHPMYYVPAQEIRRNGWLRASAMAQEYDPSWEFVAVLLKKNRESAYRIGVPSAKK